MKIQFLPADPVSAPLSKPNEPLPDSQTNLEEALFIFLRELSASHLFIPHRLRVTSVTLQALYAQPAPDVLKALHHCLDSLLVEMDPDPAIWGELEISPAVLGVALVFYTCLTQPPGPGDPLSADDLSFGLALLNSLPPATNLADILAYHAVLRSVNRVLPDLAPERAALLAGLLERSPLTAVCCLTTYLPCALHHVAEELLPYWRPSSLAAAGAWPWQDPQDWLQSLALLLNEPAIIRYLRRTWLEQAETHTGDRNLGLLLAALHRQGGQRAIILEFYEAYAHIRANWQFERRNNRYRPTWPRLADLQQLLQADERYGDETAQKLNRCGNEGYLKFYPLLEVISDDRRLPVEYRHLYLDFILTIYDLLKWASLGPGQNLDLGQVQFDEPDSTTDAEGNHDQHPS